MRSTRGPRIGSLADLLQSDRLEAVISFAGDWPAEFVVEPETVEAGREPNAAQDDGDLAEPVAAAASEGLLSLREQICAHMAAQGIKADPYEVLVTASPEASIALIVGALLQPGDTVLVDERTHPGCLAVFRQAKLRVVPIASDDEGLLIADLERLTKQHQPKLLYAMPTLGVPEATIWSEERRTALLACSRMYGMLILEDDPYGCLRFASAPSAPTPLFELDRRTGGSGVLYVSTFAALLGAQASAGWIAGSGGVMAQLANAKPAGELGAVKLQAQRKLDRLLRHCELDRHALTVRMSMASRMHRMQALLSQQGLSGVTWNDPQGGLFLWVELPPGLDAEALLRSAAAKRVSFDAGAPFYAGHPARNQVRLNVANVPEGRMAEGVARFAEAVNEFLGRSST